MIFGLLFILILLTSALIWQARERLKLEAELEVAKETIHEREHKVKTILHNAPIVFSAIDKNGILQVSEGKGLEKLGRLPNQSVGLSIYDMHNQNPVILNAVKKALMGQHAEARFVLNGIHFELFIGPLKNSEGDVIGASMLSVDTTDIVKGQEEKNELRFNAQAASETSKLKSEFLATMSHEIRTPINGILGMTSLLLDTPQNRQQREYAEVILQSGKSLLKIINDILDFSKIEAGKLDFEIIDFDLTRIIEQTTHTLNFVAKEKGIELKTEISRSLPVGLKGDPGRIQQILTNLISNAIKFTENGKVTVRADAVNFKGEFGHSTIRFEIEDTGIGLNKAALNKLFNSFSQGDASMARKFGGTGLGLSICKQLVEKMGGQIGVTSSEGKGSIFWFVLSLDIVEVELPMVNQLQPLNSHNALGHVAKILVAEDNRINQMIAVSFLEKMGYETEVVTNGLQVLEALETKTYDLILMDCQMPDMDGLEASRRIRANSAAVYRKIPIIAVTANAMKGDREACVASGMNDYVTKPIAYESLSSAIKHWVDVGRGETRSKVS